MESIGSSDNDSFLTSMTFARQSHPDCECDECGIGTTSISITEAIEHHKRQKLLYDHMSFISQERTLIKREGPVSLWKLVMPPGSDPLIEFTGNSWRCILVDKFPSGRMIKMTGTGIIGSSDECKSRKICTWKEKQVYIHPITKSGKSIGFVNEKQDQDKLLSKGDTSQYIHLYILKVTDKALEMNGNDVDSSIPELSTWAVDVISGFNDVKDSKVDVLSEETSNLFWNKIHEVLL